MNNLILKIEYFINSIKKRGLITSIRYATDNLMLKIKFPNLDFSGLINLDLLNITGNNKEHGVIYYGVTSYNFERVFKQIEIDLKDSSFLDIGCGKGKAVFLAARQGVKSIYGVEFAKELYEICLKNIDKFKNYFNSNFFIFLEDAVKFEINENINIIFLNNPFDDIVMKEVIINIKASLIIKERKLYIIYFNPLLENLFLKNHFKKIFEIKSKAKTEVALYTNF